MKLDRCKKVERCKFHFPLYLLNKIYFQDESDEANCTKVIIKDSYKNYLPPPKTKGHHKLQLEVSVEVQDIQDIIEVDKTFQVPFILFLSWRDSRLEYKNLVDNVGMNLLSKAEKDKEKGIWTPTVVFKNTNEKHKSKVDEETYIQIKKSGKSTLSPTSEYELAYNYLGKENDLIMRRYYREIFTCE